MPPHRTAFGALLNAAAAADTEEHAPAKPLNKAKHPDYMKLSAYIPKELDRQLKLAMAEEGEKDQSSYLERLLRSALAERRNQPKRRSAEAR